MKNDKTINKDCSMSIAFLEDNTISWKAKGLLAYLINIQKDNKINVPELNEKSKDGRESVYSGIKELINAGYCIRIQQRENGKISRWEYVVSCDKTYSI